MAGDLEAILCVRGFIQRYRREGKGEGNTYRMD
jgi:hypothetical protein